MLCHKLGLHKCTAGGPPVTLERYRWDTRRRDTFEHCAYPCASPRASPPSRARAPLLLPLRQAAAPSLAATRAPEEEREWGKIIALSHALRAAALGPGPYPGQP